MHKIGVAHLTSTRWAAELGWGNRQEPTSDPQRSTSAARGNEMCSSELPSFKKEKRKKRKKEKGWSHANRSGKVAANWKEV